MSPEQRERSRRSGQAIFRVRIPADEAELEGSQVELDKSIIERLSDPLTHLVRNSLDHGLEAPEDRAAAGKPESGRLTLRAFHEGGQVNIEIEDDGRGIDAAKMRRVAVERGLMGSDQAEAMADTDAVMLTFTPGFSTAAEVNDVSGHGVGMDVVNANISRLGGEITVDTEIGGGTTVRVRLPLTLPIIPSLIVALGDERFAVPQADLVEVVAINPRSASSHAIENVRGADMLRLRGRPLPLVHLSDVLGTRRRAGPDSSEPETAFHVLVLRAGEDRYGLVVDRVQDSEEIVVKPLPLALEGCRSFAGATIMADGRVAMILDVNGIAGLADLQFKELVEADGGGAAHGTAATTGSRELVLFTSAPDEHFAIDLTQVARLERIEPSQVECVGEREFLQYGGRALPLVRLERHLPVGPLEPLGDALYVIIPSAEQAPAGILVREVLDTTHSTATLDPDSCDGAIIGRAVVDGHVTTILDGPTLLTSLAGGAAV